MLVGISHASLPPTQLSRYSFQRAGRVLLPPKVPELVRVLETFYFFCPSAETNRKTNKDEQTQAPECHSVRSRTTSVHKSQERLHLEPITGTSGSRLIICLEPITGDNGSRLIICHRAVARQLRLGWKCKIVLVRRWRGTTNTR